MVSSLNCLEIEVGLISNVSGLVETEDVSKQRWKRERERRNRLKMLETVDEITNRQNQSWQPDNALDCSRKAIEWLQWRRQRQHGTCDKIDQAAHKFFVRSADL